MNQTRLLVIAHGSRRAQSNQEVLKLVAELAQTIDPNTYQSVNAAFLELADPDIPSAIHTCVSTGANTLHILPYFLSAGRHVSQDIPHFINQARSQYPQLNIDILPHFGAMPQLGKLLTQLLNTTAQPRTTTCN